MTTGVFCDNTVLCNFAAVGRVDLLASILRGRGRWTEAVAAEAEMSRGYLPDLAQLIDGRWLGEPIEVARTDAEAIRIECIRRAVFGGLPEQPTKHLGEAETTYLIKNRADFRDAWWVTDDRAAVDYGRAQGMITKETIDLMGDAVAMSDLMADKAFALLLRMDDLGRRLRLPARARDLM